MTENAQTQNKQMNRGRLFVISAPSGAGKTTLCQHLLSRLPNLAYSISHTTRRPRDGEVEGRDYFFTDKADFQKGIREKRWAEWAEVYGNFYGTSVRQLNDAKAAGRHVLLDIDIAGMRQIVAAYPDAVTIFIMPPSIEVLRQRLNRRGSDAAETIEKRLAQAVSEIDCSTEYRHVVVNDQLADAMAELVELVERCIDDGTGDGSARPCETTANG